MQPIAIIVSPHDISADAIAGPAEQITAALLRPPYFARVDWTGAPDDRSAGVELAKAIAHPARPETEDAPRVSFTTVRVDPKKSGGKTGSTAYSRTHLPLALHTDGSYQARPTNLVAFQMVRPDATGGDTTAASADALAERLTPELCAALQAPAFDFGRGPAPILMRQEAGWRIRYYRAQITQAAEKAGRAIAPDIADTLDALDAALADPDLCDRFRLEAGQILFMDNTRALHGRTGMSAQSDRLMYRIRIHAPRLAG